MDSKIYRPYAERVVDTQYKSLLGRIIADGTWYKNQMEEPALTILSAQLDYDLGNGAPLIVERDIVSMAKTGRSYVSQAIGEIIGFINGAHTQEELEKYGCYWWKNWLTPEKCGKRGLPTGDLGPGSYGSAWTAFPTLDGPFNQITALVSQIIERPWLRTHVLTPWIPQYVFRASGYKQKVVVVPCHGWVNIRINVDTGTFTLIHHQRSADIPVGFPANMVGYFALSLMIAKVTGYQPKRISYHIDDAHIYESQLEAAYQLCDAPDGKLPTVELSGNSKTITDFRTDDFIISDYFPTGGRMKIPTPI